MVSPSITARNVACRVPQSDTGKKDYTALRINTNMALLRKSKTFSSCAR